MTKADLYRLIDELPESEQETAFRILTCLKDEKERVKAHDLAEELDDPFLAFLAAAPIDDEPETPEEAEAIREAIQESERGEGIPWEEAKRRLAELPCGTWRGCRNPIVTVSKPPSNAWHGT
jgi:hypothetical protein